MPASLFRKAAPGSRAGCESGDLADDCEVAAIDLGLVVVTSVGVVVCDFAGVGFAFDLDHDSSLGSGVEPLVELGIIGGESRCLTGRIICVRIGRQIECCHLPVVLETDDEFLGRDWDLFGRRSVQHVHCDPAIAVHQFGMEGLLAKFNEIAAVRAVFGMCVVQHRRHLIHDDRRIRISDCVRGCV